MSTWFDTLDGNAAQLTSGILLVTCCALYGWNGQAVCAIPRDKVLFECVFVGVVGDKLRVRSGGWLRALIWRRQMQVAGPIVSYS